MYQIGVIGDRASIQGFLSLGFMIEDAKTADEAEEKVSELRKQNCAIVFITEELYAKIDTDIYANEPLFTLIPIPTLNSNYNIGVKRLKKAVEKAVGADILFN
jgi:V/A-type H+-transporting ATPase subunit F